MRHYIGLSDVQYFGVRSLAWGLLTRWPYVWLRLLRLREAIAQRLFNRRPLEVRRRLEVLRGVVRAKLDNGEGIDVMDLMSHRYGNRWVEHPGWESHQRALEQHLDLLVDSGDLKKAEHRYRPAGQALKTLDESEEAQRRHSANLRVQLLLALLTLVSAVMAAAQAGLVKLPTLVDFRNEATVAAEVAQAKAAQAATVAASTPGAGR